MAGSGKTTLIQRLSAHLHQRGEPGYVINLDPAVSKLPYGANIDIRDTVRCVLDAAVDAVSGCQGVVEGGMLSCGAWEGGRAAAATSAAR
jgi:ABC-type molybdenum transport system ATPase subunit/photorepair protein PhrA